VRGVIVLTSTLSVVRKHHVSSSSFVRFRLRRHRRRYGPCFSSEKMRGRVVAAHLKSWGQCRQQASSPSERHDTSTDVPGRWHEPSCFVQLVTWQRHVVIAIPSSFCGSAKWVGTKREWGYSLSYPQINNDDERRMSFVVWLPRR
jgi:hypothetical protein